MTFLGWLTIVLFVRAPDRAGDAARPLHGGRLRGRAHVPRPAVPRPRSACSTRSCGSTRSKGQDWKAYAKSLIIFSLAGWLLLYFILRTQTLWNLTGLNPEHFHSGTWNVTFNTTSSFLTNTNWQYYGGETTMSYFSQMAGLTVQNFLSAGVGIAVAVALIRGIIGRSGQEHRQLLA